MVKVTAGDDAIKGSSVCNVNYSTTMLGSIYHVAVTANPRMRQVNGILQHTVMPTLVEVRAAQKKDAGIMLVRKFVAKYARTDMDEIDVQLHGFNRSSPCNMACGTRALKVIK